MRDPGTGPYLYRILFRETSNTNLLLVQYSALQYSTVEYNTVYCVQGSFPTATNLSSATLQLARGTTPLARRTYLETTDQEMDVWIKLQLSTLAGAR